MNGVPGPAASAALVQNLARTTPPLATCLPVLLELSAASAVVLARPDGEIEMVAVRPGTTLDVNRANISLLLERAGHVPQELADLTPPPAWLTAGIQRLALQRMPDDSGVIVVAWDREPDESHVAWLRAALTLLTERVTRLRAEEQLTDLTARVDNAQHLANMGDYDWHIASDTNRWSDQLYRIYGFEPQSFNASYERFLANIHPDDRERITAIHQQAYATGEPYQMIERIIRPDGALRYLSSNGQVLRDATGTPIRMRGTCIDITDRVLAEEERERIAARFRSMVESCPDAILLIDTQGRIVQANGRAHELLDGDPVGAAAEVISPELRQAAHGVKACTLGGRAVELDVIVAELRDLDGEGLLAVYLRDASLRLADEARAAALREVQVRHRQALEINDDVVQGLTAAILAMQGDDLTATTSYLERTLAAARRIMNDWSGTPGGAAIRPGTLVRTAASTLHDPPSEPTRSQSAVPPTAGVTRTILVVDDSDDVRRLICAQLAGLGTCTLVGQAADGEEAIRLAAALQPDLVLLDLSMPRMDGLEALPRILQVAADVRVIVMSGFDANSVADQVLAAGAIRYLEKGPRMNLAAVIDEVFAAA